MSASLCDSDDDNRSQVFVHVNRKQVLADIDCATGSIHLIVSSECTWPMEELALEKEWRSARVAR
jgi:hypothetical protein